MGSRGAGSGRVGVFTSLPESKLTAGNPTAKSKEVFDRLYTDLRLLARESIERGEMNIAGYSNMHASDDEKVFTKPTLKGLQSLINSEWKSIEIGERLKATTPENIKVKRYAITMMQKMLNKYYESVYGGI